MLRARGPVALLLALALVAGGVSGCTSGTPLVKPDFSKARVRMERGVTDADFAAIRRLLDVRAKALLQGDRRRFLATLDRGNPRLRNRQTVLFDNLRALPVERLYYGFDPVTLLPDKVRGRDLTVRPVVFEHVQLRGINRRPVANQVSMTFVKRGSRWLLGTETVDTTFESQARPWYGVPLESAGDAALLVLTDRGAEVGAEELLGSTRSALAQVVDVLDESPDGPLLVDATTNGLAYELSSSSGEDAGAVFYGTYATDRAGNDYRGEAGSVVKANPDYVAQLVEDDQTLRHELTHYVLDEYGDTNPQWVTEGIAEYVGYFPGLLADSTATSPGLGRLVAAREVELTPPGRWGDDPALDYLTAEAFTEYLVSRYGLDDYRTMMDTFRRLGTSYGEGVQDRVLDRVYGLDADDVARGGFAILDELTSRPGRPG